jgi:DNA-binding NtrC family response regulator
VTLRIPPLRERQEDIPLIAEHYLRAFCREHGRDPKRLTREAIETLRAYPWPGNVRELKNTMESVVVFHRGEEVGAEDLPVEILEALGLEGRPVPVLATVGGEESEEGAVETHEPAPGGPARSPDGGKTMAGIERDAILAALARTSGRRVEAARLLDIGLRTLQRKLKEYKEQGYWEE